MWEDERKDFDREAPKDLGMVRKEYQFGQHDPEHPHALNGIGRRIVLYEQNECLLWEGQFVNNKLNGFGRYMRVHPEGTSGC